MNFKVIIKQFIFVLIFAGEKDDLIVKHCGKKLLQKFPGPDWLT